MIRVSFPVFVFLLFEIRALAVVQANSGDILVRKRREWVLPPKPLKENQDYTKQESIAKIRSDFDTGSNLHYSLEGIGANQFPFHVFVVDPNNGNVRVTQVLDREEIDTYNLSGVATFINGSLAEKKIDLRIKVVDENDNSPVFEKPTLAEVDELSPEGHYVTSVSASDADEPENINSKISYSIIKQNPAHDMFYIKRDGTIYVKSPSLDREKCDQYILTVQGKDLDGASLGKVGTGTVTINVRDVNDNPPTLGKDEYEGSIDENTSGVEVMRLKAEDLDLKGTDNWEAVFDIVEGNEAGYFSIRTDPNTNEGILMLDKPVDYEDVKNLELGLAVRNKAPLIDGSQPTSAGINLSGASGASSRPAKTYPIKISVKNQPEGPRFRPKVKNVPVSEGDSSFSTEKIIARYPAIDGDTGKQAENVRYARGSDPDNWLTIDPKTAEIKLKKKPDRESPYLVNGTYFAEVLCITEDMPAKTATGTVAIQVGDSNDNYPILTSKIHTMCTTETAVVVNATDQDMHPNGPPFQFKIIPEGTKGKWLVEYLSGTAAKLRAQESMWPGIYEVELVVEDNQGLACPEPQRVTVEVCTCEDGDMCGIRGAAGQTGSEGVKFGPAGIGLLLLGLLLLLLIPLLLVFCQCGGAEHFKDLFAEMPFDTKSHLINYHTEGLGENTEVPLLNAPVAVDGYLPPTTTGMVKNPVAMAPVGSLDYQQSVAAINGMTWSTYQDGYSSAYRNSEFGTRDSRRDGEFFDGIALPYHFLGQYYTEMTSGNDNLCVKDGLLVYDYEGQGSPAGSVGCSSLLESDNDLQFLDDLGLKFKTLAEVCGGNKIHYDEKKVVPPLPSASINTQTSVSSLSTAQKLSPPPKLEPTIPKVEQSVVRETNEHSEMVKESMATVRETMTTVNSGLAKQGQMLLVQQQQQPVYYTTTPVLQPMHYVVQPQVQNTVLLAEAPATNLQGMVLVNNTQSGPPQGVFLQGQTLMSTGQAQGPSMVLVENNEVQENCANLIQAGNLSGSQTMMVVESKIPTGSLKVLKGSQTSFVQGGTLQSRGLSGSKRVVMVGEPTIRREELVQEAGGLSKKSEVLYSKSSRSTSSKHSKKGSLSPQ